MEFFSQRKIEEHYVKSVPILLVYLELHMVAIKPQLRVPDAHTSYVKDWIA